MQTHTTHTHKYTHTCLRQMTSITVYIKKTIIAYYLVTITISQNTLVELSDVSKKHHAVTVNSEPNRSHRHRQNMITWSSRTLLAQQQYGHTKAHIYWTERGLNTKRLHHSLSNTYNIGDSWTYTHSRQHTDGIQYTATHSNNIIIVCSLALLQ